MIPPYRDARALEAKSAALSEVLRSTEAEEAVLRDRCETIRGQCRDASEERERLVACSAELRDKMSAASVAREAEVARCESAQAAESEALRQVNEARIELALWRSRSEALSKARPVTAGLDPEFLASLNGLEGILGDLLSPETGWEEAFEAAVGEFTSALVVEGADAAREVFEALKREGVGGVVLPVLPGCFPQPPVRGGVLEGACAGLRGEGGGVGGDDPRGRLRGRRLVAGRGSPCRPPPSRCS